MKSRLAPLLALLTLATSALAAPPANDKFAKATALTTAIIGANYSVVATNVDATPPEKDEPSGDGTGRTVWYKYVAPADGYLVISYDMYNDMSTGVALNGYSGTALKKLNWIFGQAVTEDWINVRKIAIYPVVKGGNYRFAFDDSFGDPGEFGFSYRLVQGGAFDFAAPRTLTEVSNDGGFVYGYKAPDWTFHETDGTVEIVVHRKGGSEGAATVQYTIVEGSAQEGTDYTGDVSGELFFAPGDTMRTISLNLVNDAAAEGEENFTVELSEPSDNATILTASATFTIEDSDDLAPNDHFADAEELTGNTGSVNTPPITGTTEEFEPETSKQSVWYYWTAPDDGLLELSVTSFEWAVDAKVMAFTGTDLTDAIGLLALGDRVQQPRGKMTIPVSSGTVYTIAVINNYSGDNILSYAFSPRSGFRFSQTSYEVLEAGTNVTLTVQRVGNLSGAASVHYETIDDTADDTDTSDDTADVKRAKKDEDFLSKVGDLLFADGVATPQTFQVTIVNDKKAETLEYFPVRLSTALPDDSEDPVTVKPDEALVYIDDSKKPVDRVNYHFFGNWIAVYKANGAGGKDGTVQVTFTKNRGFTGSLLLDGKKYALKGAFPALTTVDGFPVSEVTVTPTKAPAGVTVTLRLRAEMNDGAALTGKVTSASTDAEFESFRVFKYAADNPPATTGTYTLVLESVAGVPGTLEGKGVMSITIKKTGAFTLAGSLSDGMKITGGGQVAYRSPTDAYGTYDPTAATEVIPIGVPLYSGMGSLSGYLRLAFAGDTSTPPEYGDGEGYLRWVHPALAKGVVTTAFRADLAPFASKYDVAKGAGILPGLTVPTIYNLTAEDGGLSADVNAQFTLKPPAAAKLVQANDPTKATLTFNITTGLFSGKFLEAPGAKASTHAGAILRNIGRGEGYFLRPVGTDTFGGSIELREAP